MKTEKVDYVVASDTDSIYIRMGDVVKKMGLGDDIKKTVKIKKKYKCTHARCYLPEDLPKACLRTIHIDN